MMAVRLARAATGRPKLVKLQGNFHGWADSLFAGIDPPFEMPSAGLPPGVHESVITLPTNDVQALENALSNRDVAAFIIEGAGAHMGTIPTSAEYARAARELCTKYGTIFIIDEVVSGFRWAPGGWQETIGVEPDISTMAKILMGAMPGGCVAGKEDILNVIQHTGDAERDRAKRMPHPGTFNANPVSVAAGIACLKIIATGEPHRIANAAAETLRQQMHAALQERGISGFAYATPQCSTFTSATPTPTPPSTRSFPPPPPRPSSRAATALPPATSESKCSTTASIAGSASASAQWPTTTRPSRRRWMSLTRASTPSWKTV